VSIVVEGALAVVLAGVAAIVIALAVKLFKSLSESAGRTEDARMIQEVYQGLSRLEGRIETLETILFDRKKEGRDA
jgi:phage shock protein B